MLRLPAAILLALTPARATRLRLVSFNIHGWRDADHTDRLSDLIKAIAALRPDVVCLNEVLFPFVGPPKDNPYWEAVRERRGYLHPPPAGSRPDERDEDNYLRRLAAALGLPHICFGAAVGTDPEPRPFARCFFAQYPFGNAILSRFPLSDVRHSLLSVSPADLTCGDQPRTDSDLEHRALTTARLRLPGGGSLGVAVTHLDHKAEALRERQVAAAVERCAGAFGSLPHVLCGDLNSFSRGDMSARQWSEICALYESRGWGE